MLGLLFVFLTTASTLINDGGGERGAGRGGDRLVRPRIEWRRAALENMRVAAAGSNVFEPAELQMYRDVGFNTLVSFDADGTDEAGTAWNLKSEARIAAETAIARQAGMPLVVGLAVESYVVALASKGHGFAAPRPSFGGKANGLIPAATDAEIRERLELWKKHGADIVVGVFPWYDDVFWHRVEVERQRHVYRLIKDVVPDWYVFGMIGDSGFSAGEDDVARLYDPGAFDHLIVLMYPYNVGYLTGFRLDHSASSDPDADVARYVDRFIERMNEKFFSRLESRQLILMVYQAFHYDGEPAGHIPRGRDIEIMTRRGNEQLGKLAGQQRNFSAAYFHWGSEGTPLIGFLQRADWRTAVRDVIDHLERRRPRIRF